MHNILSRLREIDCGNITSNYLKVYPKDLEFGHSKNLWIKVVGMRSSGEDPDNCNIMIEFFEGKVRVHVWNGECDPETTEIHPTETMAKIINAEREELALLLPDVQNDPDTGAILEQRLNGWDPTEKYEGEK